MPSRRPRAGPARSRTGPRSWISSHPCTLEVMVEGRHTEHALAGQLEASHLSDHRQGLEDEQAADQRKQQLGAAEDGQRGYCPTQRQRAGVPHEDARRRCVPPQESDARTGDRGRDHGQIQRIPHFIAPHETAEGAVLPVLPHPEQGVGHERDGTGSSGQTVQPVGQIHCVGGRGDEEPDPQDQQHGGQHDRGVPYQRDGVTRRRPAEFVRDTGCCRRRR